MAALSDAEEYAAAFAETLAGDAAESSRLDTLDYTADGLGASRLKARAAESDVDALPEPPDLLHLSSTALMHAYQTTWCLVSCEELAVQQTRYLRVLAASGVDPAGAVFMRLFGIYKELLMGPIFSAGPWATKARLFRALLLFEPEQGGWEPSAALAVALQASDAPPPRAAAGGLQRARHAVQALLSAAATEGVADGGVDTAAVDDAAAAYYDSRRRLDVAGAPRKAQQRHRFSTPMGDEANSDDADVCGAELGGDTDAWLDDPLHFSGSA